MHACARTFSTRLHFIFLNKRILPQDQVNKENSSNYTQKARISGRKVEKWEKEEIFTVPRGKRNLEMGEGQKILYLGQNIHPWVELADGQKTLFLVFTLFWAGLPLATPALVFCL